MKYHVIIPARLNSSRLNNKVLQKIGGKELILKTLENAKTYGASSVHVATDSPEIAALVQKHNGQVVMTSNNPKNGTERVFEASKILALADDEVVINLQADEPFIDAAIIKQMLCYMESKAAMVATISCQIRNQEEFLDPNAVKVMMTEQGDALYFTRSPIPANKESNYETNLAKRHVGIYALTVAAMDRYCKLGQHPIEKQESLEQLRFVMHGHKIAVYHTDVELKGGIDTLADLQLANQGAA